MARGGTARLGTRRRVGRVGPGATSRAATPAGRRRPPREGNRAEALRACTAYEQLLATQLGVAPTSPFRHLVALGDARDVARRSCIASRTVGRGPDGDREAGPDPMADPDPTLRILGGFELRVHGRPVAVPPQGRRILAYLALRDRPVARSQVAGTLWPALPDDRAAANLRTALWRTNILGVGVVAGSRSDIWLTPKVRVDHGDALRSAHTLLDPGPVTADRLVPAGLTDDLLPGWDEDWVLTERERLRQLRLHALDALCDRLLAAGEPARAVEAGRTAVAADPLRETARCALVRALLAAGERAVAHREERRFRALLAAELGAAPTPALAALLAGG